MLGFVPGDGFWRKNVIGEIARHVADGNLVRIECERRRRVWRKIWRMFWRMVEHKSGVRLCGRLIYGLNRQHCRFRGGREAARRPNYARCAARRTLSLLMILSENRRAPFRITPD